MKDRYYIYILRCEDKSLYTGIAKDYKDRYKKHLDGTGAKYTRARKPAKIERVWSTRGRSAASKVECLLKKSTRLQKEDFIKTPDLLKFRVEEKLGIELEEVELKF